MWSQLITFRWCLCINWIENVFRMNLLCLRTQIRFLIFILLMAGIVGLAVQMDGSATQPLHWIYFAIMKWSTSPKAPHQRAPMPRIPSVWICSWSNCKFWKFHVPEAENCACVDGPLGMRWVHFNVVCRLIAEIDWLLLTGQQSGHFRCRRPCCTELLGYGQNQYSVVILSGWCWMDSSRCACRCLRVQQFTNKIFPIRMPNVRNANEHVITVGPIQMRQMAFANLIDWTFCSSNVQRTIVLYSTIFYRIF